MASLRPPTRWRLAVTLGLVTTFATLANELTQRATGVELDEIGGLSVFGLGVRLVAVVTLLVVCWQTFSGRGWRDAAVVVAGPLFGLGVGLAVMIALNGPSTDSPTWLIYLAVCVAAAVAGGVAYSVGRVARRVRQQSAKPRV